MVRLESLRMEAALDASGYVKGAAAKTAADKAMVDSAGKVDGALEVTERRVDRLGQEIAKTSRQLQIGAEKLRDIQKLYSAGVERGLISQEEANKRLEVAAQRYGQGAAAAGRFSGALAAQGQQAGLTRMQLMTLQYTFNDVVASMSSGINPMTILLQQGGQVTQAFGGLRGALAAITPLFNPVVMGVGAAAATLAVVGVRAAEVATETRAYGVMLQGLGRDAVLSAAQVRGLTDALRANGLAQKDAREAAAGIARAPGIDLAQAQRIAKLLPDFAAGTGLAAAEAAHRLTEMGSQGYAAILKLDEAYRFLDPSQAAHIRQLARQGDQAGATAIAMDALEGRMTGLAQQGMSRFDAAITAVGTAWRALVDSLLNDTWVGKFLNSVVEGVSISLDYLARKMEGLPKAVELARLNQQLADMREGRDADGSRSLIGPDSVIGRAAQDRLRQQISALEKELERERAAKEESARANAALNYADAQKRIALLQEEAKFTRDLAGLSEEQRRIKLAERKAQDELSKINIADEKQREAFTKSFISLELARQQTVASGKAKEIEQHKEVKSRLDEYLAGLRTQMDMAGEDEQARTRIEAITRAQAEAARDYAAGLRDTSLITAAEREEVVRLVDERERLTQKRRANEKAARQAEEEQRRQMQETARIVDQYSGRIADSIYDAFAEGKSAAQSFKEFIKGVFRDIAINSIIRPIIQPVVMSAVGALTGVSLGGGSAQASTGGLSGGGVGIGDILGVGKLFSGGSNPFAGINSALFGSTITTLAPGTALAPGAIMISGSGVSSLTSGAGGVIGSSGFLGSGGTLLGSAFAADAFLPVVGSAIGGLMSGNYIQAGLGAGGALLGTAIGGPIGGAIGGLAGNLLGGLFGGKSSPPNAATGGAFDPVRGIIETHSDGKGNSSENQQKLIQTFQSLYQITSQINQIPGIKLNGMITGLNIGNRDPTTINYDTGQVRLNSVGDFNAVLEDALHHFLQYATVTSDNIRAALDRSRLADAATLIDNLKFGALVDQFLAAKPALTDVQTAMKALNDQFDQMTGRAQSLGMNVFPIAQKFAENFDHDVSQALLKFTNPAKLALDQDALDAQARLDTAKKIGAAFVQTEQLNYQIRKQLLDQYTDDQLKAAGVVRDVLSQLEHDLAAARTQAGTALDAQIQASQQGAQAMAQAAQQWRAYADSMAATIADLRTGALSTLSPLEKYQEQSARLDALSAAAAQGNQSAYAALPQLANSFLAASGAYNGSTTAYAADFARVQSVLSQAGIDANGFAGHADYQSQALDAQTRLLQSIKDNLGAASPQADLLREQIAALNVITDLTREQTGVIKSGDAVKDIIERLNAGNLAFAQDIASAVRAQAAATGTLMERIAAGNATVTDLLSAYLQIEIAKQQEADRQAKEAAARAAAEAEARRKAAEAEAARQAAIKAQTDPLNAQGLAQRDFDPYAEYLKNGLQAAVEGAFKNILLRTGDQSGVNYWLSTFPNLSPSDWRSTFISGAQKMGEWDITQGRVEQLRQQIRDLGGIPAFAVGGLVAGPGTGTSDSVIARLSDREFVMPAAATARFLPELEAMRRGQDPGNDNSAVVELLRAILAENSAARLELRDLKGEFKELREENTRLRRQMQLDAQIRSQDSGARARA